MMATFGTTVPRALQGILNMQVRIKHKYPKSEVKIAFTSNIIRSIWHKRQTDQTWQKKNPSIPNEIMFVKGPLATIANLQDRGFKTIIVQPGHLSLGEEYLDLTSYINGLNSIKTIKKTYQPFTKLVISRPALGAMGKKHPYPDDIELVAKALAGDVQIATKENAALVYMGHGNDYFPSGGAYLQFADTMNKLYPHVKTYIGNVEGFPRLDNVIKNLQSDNIVKIILKPFMTVAGDHALNDMAGEENTSWKSTLTRQGFEVKTIMQGLGEIDSFADVYVHHLTDTAKEHGIVLR